MEETNAKKSLLDSITNFFVSSPKEESQERDDSHKFGSEVRHKVETFFINHVESKLKHPGEFLADVLRNKDVPPGSTMDRFIELSNEVDAEFAAQQPKKSMVEKIGGSITNGAKTAKNWIGSKLPTFKRNKK
jgi:hypothetical protein